MSEIQLGTPAELGLPAKFTSFRPQQMEALERIKQTDKKIVLCQAPTGTGKTLLMAAMQKYLKTQVLYTCHTKQLQTQVVDDFPESVELKGRANYPCAKKNGLNCAQCTMKRGNRSEAVCKECGFDTCEAKNGLFRVSECPCKDYCPYIIQKQRALVADLAILNMPFFLNEANFIGGFSGWRWVVLDEGDLTENSLMSHIEVTFTAELLERLKLERPATKASMETWVKWIDEQAGPAIGRRIQELADTMDANEMQELEEMQRLAQKLRYLTRQNLKGWVFVPGEDQWQFKPVFISYYANEFLWRHGIRFLVMSATLVPGQLRRDLGLKEEDTEFINLPSSFPPERRPIYFMPRADVTKKNQDSAWAQVTRAMDEIIAGHPQDKGMVHTVSYQLARYVYDHSKHKARLLQHDTKSRLSALEDFKGSDQPLVLISPSMSRGVNLPHEQCRFQIICKVPYLYLGDPQVSQRLYSAKDGNVWYAVQAISAIVQSTGRGMRSEDDECESYILDEQFRRLYREYANLFPSWWRAALKGRG